MVDRQIWGRLRLVGPDGDQLGTWVVAGAGSADLAAVDEVARACLLASRMGGRVVFETACPELLELVSLAGLCLEMSREAEGSEKVLGVEEVKERTDRVDPSV